MSTDPVPFRAVLAPWIGAGSRLLDEDLATADSPLGPAARDDLEAWLAGELADAAGPALLEGFLQFPGRRSMSARSRAGYRHYVDHLTRTSLAGLLGDHPELASVLDDVIAGWSARVSSLVDALVTDRAVLEERFGIVGPIERAAPVGEAVVGLRAANDRTVVYKGRPMDMDAAFGRLLAVVNRRRIGPALAAPPTVDRGAHGWTGYVPLRAPADRRETAAYWHRVGMLACIVHAIGGGDVHAGNVRVDGEHPVIIDGEVLLRPRRASVDDPAPDVLATGWLPTVQETERCGLAAVPHEARSSRWVDPGTDGMRRRTMRSPLRGIRPAVLDGFSRLCEGDGLANLLDGFAAAHRSIRDDGLPLEVFTGCRPRVLLRSSYLYQDAMERSCEPESLGSAAARERVFRRLTAETPPALQGRPAAARAVAWVEREAMAAGRVPRFTMAADGQDLEHRGRNLGRVFNGTPLDRASAFIAAMDDRACATQCELIAEVVTAAAADRLGGGDLRLTPRPELSLAGL